MGCCREGALAIVSVCAGAANPSLDTHDRVRETWGGALEAVTPLSMSLVLATCGRKHRGEMNTGEVRGKVRYLRPRPAVGISQLPHILGIPNAAIGVAIIRGCALVPCMTDNGGRHGASPHLGTLYMRLRSFLPCSALPKHHSSNIVFKESILYLSRDTYNPRIAPRSCVN